MAAAELENQRPAAWIITFDTGTGTAHRVWGLTAGERLRRSLLGTHATGIRRIRPDETPPEWEGPCIVFREDHVYDERLLQGLVAARDCVLFHRNRDDEPEIAIAARVEGRDLARAIALVGASTTAASDALGTLREVRVLDLAPAYDPRLRKFAPPFAYRATAENLVEIENQIFAASYKGITDLVTKWVFPRPARAVVRILAKQGVHPNAVTAMSYWMVGITTWFFAEGWFAAGLALAWAMTFLDTVDGKLARCTLTSTRFGNVFDHGLDLVHPPIWWAAWAIGMPGGIAGHEIAFWIVVGGYVVGRLLEAIFTLAFGIQLFVWRPFDAFFRTIIARRNPNLILLTASVLIGRPTWGFLAVAAWTTACIAIAAARNVQAHRLARQGVAIRPWLDDLEPGPPVEV